MEYNPPGSSVHGLFQETRVGEEGCIKEAAAMLQVRCGEGTD